MNWTSRKDRKTIGFLVAEPENYPIEICIFARIKTEIAYAIETLQQEQQSGRSAASH